MGKTGKNAAQKVITGAVAEADKRFKRRGKRLFAAKCSNESLHGRAYLPRRRITQKRSRYGVSCAEGGKYLCAQARQLRGIRTFRQMQGNQQAAEEIITAGGKPQTQAEQRGYGQGGGVCLQRLQQCGDAALQPRLQRTLENIGRRCGRRDKCLPGACQCSGLQCF